MATHSQNIDNLRNAVYGEQVRTSMIQLFEEDYALVKGGIGIGTDVSSASSPLGDYVDGNVYINSTTLDVFKCNGTAWVKVGNLKGIADITTVPSSVDDGLNQITLTLTDGTVKTFNVKNGSKGSTGDTGNGISSITTAESTADAGNNSVTIAMTDGTSKSFNVKNGSKGSTGDAAGFGTPTASIDRNTGTPSVTVTASGPDTAKVFNFDFKNIKGETGDKGDTGRSLTSITSIDSGKNHTLTATYSDGISNVITTLKDGNDGTGVGDMVKATYDTNDNGIVDKSEALFDSATGTTIPATTVLSKADKSTTLAGYGISDAYTKTQVNSKLDDKVNEPSTEGTAGQALVTNGSGGRSWQTVATEQYIESTTSDFSVTSKELALSTQIKNKLSYHFTTTEWNAITDKSAYDGKIVIIDDDYDSNIKSTVTQCVASTNADDVAGASALKELNTKLSNLGNWQTVSITPVDSAITLNEARSVCKYNPNLSMCYLNMLIKTASVTSGTIANLGINTGSTQKFVPIFNANSGAVIARATIEGNTISVTNSSGTSLASGFINFTFVV